MPPGAIKHTTFLREPLRPLLITDKSLRGGLVIEAEDENNITGSTRCLYHYAEFLGIDDRHYGIQNFIKSHAVHVGSALQILDAGCGQGVAIGQILKDLELREIVRSCVGISIHYFANIGRLINEHPNRMKFYHGAVEDILCDISNKFDIIFDVCGPFLYSVDKLALLAQYYQALKPGGKCYIRCCRQNISLETDKGNIELIEYLTRNFAQIFRVTTDKSRILMTKSQARYPVPKFKVDNFYGSITTLSPGSIKKAKLGNAWAPTLVLYSSAAEEARTLRPILFTSKKAKFVA